MADLAEPDPPCRGTRRSRELAWSFRSLTLAHPAVFQLLLDTPRPAALGAAAESAIKRLITAGFTTERAVLVFRTFIRYLLGVVVIEADIPPDDAHDRAFGYGIETLLKGIEPPR